MPAPTATTPIDAVDDRDRRVGTVARGDALRTGSNFRTAHVFVLNSRSEIVLQRLASTRERHPGRWGSSVAAYLYAGESYEHAAARRLREELGLGSPLREVGKLEMRDEGSLKFVTLFSAQGEPEILEPDHISALKSCPLAKVDDELRADPSHFTPTFVQLYLTFGSDIA